MSYLSKISTTTDANGLFLTGKSLLVLGQISSRLLDFSAITLSNINQNSSLQEGQSLYLAGLFSNPETVKMLNCSCLASTQEEADTRIILHALYSDKLYQENNVGENCSD
jgi:hypothetical protein